MKNSLEITGKNKNPFGEMGEIRVNILSDY
jgi:hypothetical protein